jgi:hypothetical protein
MSWATAPLGTDIPPTAVRQPQLLPVLRSAPVTCTDGLRWEGEGEYRVPLCLSESSATSRMT